MTPYILQSQIFYSTPMFCIAAKLWNIALNGQLVVITCELIYVVQTADR